MVFIVPIASCGPEPLSTGFQDNGGMTVSDSTTVNDKNDINFGRVLIGVITVLSGSMGLVLRGLATD